MLINNADSARMATEYLIANGHKEIGYLRGDFRIKPFRSRFAGYQTALQKAGLPLNKDYIFTMATTIDLSLIHIYLGDCLIFAENRSYSPELLPGSG